MAISFLRWGFPRTLWVLGMTAFFDLWQKEQCATIGKTKGGFAVKYLKQALIIFAFTMIGQVLEWIIPLPIPAAIYGFLLLFLALMTGLLKKEHIDETAKFLISIMGILYVAPAVNLLSYYDIIAPKLAGVITVVVLSTVIVFGVSGWVTQLLSKKEEKKDA